MLCCANCFGDKYISEKIISSRNSQIGACDYCKKNQWDTHKSH